MFSKRSAIRGYIIDYHKQKDVNDAIEEAVGKGWRWMVKGNGHTKGYLCCTPNSVGTHKACECMISVFGTPKSPTNHAKKIRQAINGYSC